jgi:ParB family chromosome partitioning protein
MSADTPRRLGRGLEALISTARQQREPAAPEPMRPEAPQSDLQSIRIADIQANAFQPRRTFSEQELAELSASIQASGLLQPITVRPKRTGGWELVAGERRLRAATRLGWTEIPAIVRAFDDRDMLTLALVENLQRSDLNALEEAEGYKRLMDEFGLTQQQVADAVGKDRTTVANLLRVLNLPPIVRKMVESGHLTAGHARALLAVKDAEELTLLANEAVARQLSVREVEARARAIGAPQSGKSERGSKAPAVSTNADPQIRRIEDQLRKRLQTDVSIQQQGKDGGTLRISFYGHDDLERVLEVILGRGRTDFD